MVWDYLCPHNPVLDHQLNVLFDEITVCPQCKAIISPKVLQTATFFDRDNKRRLAVIFLCEGCKRSFIAQYSVELPQKNPSSYSGTYFKNVDFCGPQSLDRMIFAKEINDVSTSFVEIYNQALAAETIDLLQIAGVGYRKALEFLIKDFLIAQKPNDISKIKSTFLGTCIDQYIDDPQLKSLAKGAGYLGNDQTHYEQKYTDKDIHDLKRFITAAVNTIQNILIAAEAESLPHPSTL